MLVVVNVTTGFQFTLLDLSVDWQDFQQRQRNLPQTETLGRSSQSWAGTEDNEESNRALIIGCTERSAHKKMLS